MEGLLSLLLFALFFYFMMRVGCGSHMVHGSHGSHEKEINHIDPVCGMKVDPNKGYGKMQNGNLYRFCSKNCLEKFDEDPESYITGQNGRT